MVSSSYCRSYSPVCILAASYAYIWAPVNRINDFPPRTNSSLVLWTARNLWHLIWAVRGILKLLGPDFAPESFALRFLRRPQMRWLRSSAAVTRRQNLDWTPSMILYFPTAYSSSSGKPFTWVRRPSNQLISKYFLQQFFALSKIMMLLVVRRSLTTLSK